MVLVFLVVTVVLVYNNCIPTRKVTQQAKGRYVYFSGATPIENTQTGHTKTLPGSYYVKDGSGVNYSREVELLHCRKVPDVIKFPRNAGYGHSNISSERYMKPQSSDVKYPLNVSMSYPIFLKKFIFDMETV